MSGYTLDELWKDLENGYVLVNTQMDAEGSEYRMWYDEDNVLHHTRDGVDVPFRYYEADSDDWHIMTLEECPAGMTYLGSAGLVYVFRGRDRYYLAQEGDRATWSVELGTAEDVRDVAELLVRAAESEDMAKEEGE